MELFEQFDAIHLWGLLLLGWFGWAMLSRAKVRLRRHARVRVTLALPVVVIVGSLIIGVVSDARARDGAFVIRSMDIRMAVAEDGSTLVEEDIEVVFREPRRGIIRELPAELGALSHLDDDSPAAGSAHLRDYELLLVTMDGEPVATHDFRSDGNQLNWRIGSSNVWLDPGTYHYHLRYRTPSWTVVDGPDATVAETRIDMPGFTWPAPIRKANVSLWLPGEISDAACVHGPIGSTRSCDRHIRIDEDGVLRASLGSFSDHMGATISAFSPADGFTVPPPEATLPQLDRGFRPMLMLPRKALTLLLALLLTVPAVVLLTVESRRIYRLFGSPTMHDRVQPTALFEPPAGLDPVQVAGLLGRVIPDELVLSMLIFASQRRQIIGSFTGDKASFTAADGIEIANPILRQLLPLELSEKRDAEVAAKLDRARSIAERRAREVLSSRRLMLDSGQQRDIHNQRERMFGIFGVSALVLTVGAIGWSALSGLAVFGVVVLCALALLVHEMLWHSRRWMATPEGHDLVRQAEAFEVYLATVEAEQLEWAATQQDPDHLHPAVALLPYAMAVGLADSWYQRFGGLLKQQAPSDWTSYPEHYHYVERRYTTSKQPPATSGGSGGGSFSGGGFSGGGGSFGGGGGGAGSGGGGGGGRSW